MKTPAEILSKLPENYIAKIRLLAANYRIAVEDTPFVYTLIQDCNEALEKKDFKYFTGFEEIDENNPIGI